MLASVRYLLSDLGHWLVDPPLAAAAGVVVVPVGVARCTSPSARRRRRAAAAPPRARRRPRASSSSRCPRPENTDDLGFPAFATKNTTRIAGADPIANAAAVALAVHPSTGDSPGPDAVTLVDVDDWQGAIAASVARRAAGRRAAAGHRGRRDPAAHRERDPRAGPGRLRGDGRPPAVRDRDAAAPTDYETLEVDGGDPAALAAEVDKLRGRLAGEPDAIVVASSDAAPYAIPAAAWAARSGDPVLFTGKDSVPEETVKALRSHDGTPVFVLGPESVIGPEAMKEIEHVAPGTERVGADGSIENAIAFARFSSGGFGWNINDPGHGFVIANTDHPLDAAVASPLSASGTWGPLLVTDDGSALPASLSAYLLDLKPGYADDPTRAVYNHVWLIGDTSALSVDLQAEVDELAEVAPVTSGSGAGAGSDSSIGPEPGTPESQPNAPKPDTNRNRDQR